MPPSSLFLEKGPALDVGYTNIRDSSDQFVVRVRAEIDKLWAAFKPYADREFPGEFARQMEQRYWEMYLGCTLLDLGFQLDLAAKGYTAKRFRPDICARRDGKRYWFEAVAPTSGAIENKDRVPDIVVSNPPMAHRVPVDQIILRFLASIAAKRTAFERYRDAGVVDRGDCCVIALSGASIGVRASIDREMPYILRALFPIGEFYAAFEQEKLEAVETGYKFRDAISKVDGAKVDVGFFLNSDSSLISGLVYCGRGVANTRLPLGSDILLVHNPMAGTPLPAGILSRGAEYTTMLNDDRFSFQIRRYHVD